MSSDTTCGLKEIGTNGADLERKEHPKDASTGVNRHPITDKHLPRIPARGIYNHEARLERLKFLREQTQAKLDLVGNTSIDPKALVGNLEDFFGSVEIPIGAAGPLKINGKHANGFFYAPLATTEGALVASMNRGAKAISLSEGATSRVLEQRITRVPVFTFFDIDSAFLFSKWVDQHFEDIYKEAKKYSEYAVLKQIEHHLIGRNVHLEFIYETGDAAGQNMITHCTWMVTLWIVDQLKDGRVVNMKEFWVDDNLSCDKKVTYYTFIRGRGIRVISEAFIPSDIVKSILKVDAQTLFNFYKAEISSSIRSGMIGFNINIANALASIFTATGQDVASVHESSIGQFEVNYTGDGIYANILLPGLTIGTVGGGTALPHQRECLELLGCAGKGKVYKFAEIIAAYCLALDLSTLAALASNQFAYAHERFGKNRPKLYIQKENIDASFASEIMQGELNEKIEVHHMQPITATLGSSIITQLASERTKKLLGHLPYKIQYQENGREKIVETDVVIKIKPTDEEVMEMLNTVANYCDSDLATAWRRINILTEFKNCHIREVELYKERDERFTKHVPKIYGLYRNDKKEAFLIMQEFLKDMILMDTAHDTSHWKEVHIKNAIDGIAAIHSIWYQKLDELRKIDWLCFPSKDQRSKLCSFFSLLAQNAHHEFPSWIGKEDLQRSSELIESIPTWWKAVDQMPKTLIHNDFNPRNLAFRGDLTPCIYDWELATVHLPQYDLAELLAFVSTANVDDGELKYYVDYHRRRFEQITESVISKDDWWDGFRYSFWDFSIYRFGMYLMSHTARYFDFLERVVSSTKRILSLIK